MIPAKSPVNELSSYGVARSTVQGKPLSDEEARQPSFYVRESGGE